MKQLHKKIGLVAIIVAGSFATKAQVKIGDNPTTINGGSLLELESTNKALTLPRMTGAQMNAIPTPINGMMIYNSDSSCVCQYKGGVWRSLCNPDVTYRTEPNFIGSEWFVLGNTGTIPPTSVGSALTTQNFWGTRDAKNLAVGTSGITRAIFDQSGSLYGGSGTFDVNYPVQYSLTWGLNNKDSAAWAFVSGYNNILKTGGYGSVLGGNSNIISGAYTIANGYQNIGVNNHYSGQFGLYNNDSSYATLIAGEKNAIGAGNAYSVAAGLQNLITGNGNRNFIFGSYDTVVNGFNNLLSGSSNKSIGGGNNFIHGTLNTVINTVPTQGYQVVSGTLNTTYDAWKAAVFGSKHKDSAQYSLVSGYEHILTPGMNNAAVVGQYNLPFNDALFVVGDGNSVTRSNAFVVTRLSTSSAATNGRVITAAQLPIYATDAAADADSSLPSGGFYKLTGSRAIHQKP